MVSAHGREPGSGSAAAAAGGAVGVASRALPGGSLKGKTATFSASGGRVGRSAQVRVHSDQPSAVVSDYLSWAKRDQARRATATAAPAAVKAAPQQERAGQGRVAPAGGAARGVQQPAAVPAAAAAPTGPGPVEYWPTKVAIDDKPGQGRLRD